MPPRRVRLVALGVMALVGIWAAQPSASAPGVKAAFSLLPAVQAASNPACPGATPPSDLGSWVRHSSPVVADLGLGGPSIVVGSMNGRVYALRVGREQPDWVRDLGTYIDSSPAIADLDGDGVSEVLIGAGNEFQPRGAGVHVLDGRTGAEEQFWPAPPSPFACNHVGVFSTPAVGDVDGDGRPDVAYGSFNERIYVKDRAGNDLPAWREGKHMRDTIWSSPALADLDGDGRAEVVIGSDLGGGLAVFGCPKPARGMVSIFDDSGGFTPGWPKCMDTPIWSSPAVVDLNGDGLLDVVVGTNNYTEGGRNVGNPSKVYAWDSTGRQLWVADLGEGQRVFSSPAVGDVTGDGKVEVAVGTIRSDNVGFVYLLDGQTGAVLWRRDDGGAADCCIFMGSPVIADVNGGAADVIAAGGNGALFIWDGAGNPTTVGLGKTFFNSPAVADADGDGRNDIVVASANLANPPVGQVWVLEAGSASLGPWPVFKRTAARTASLGVGRQAAWPRAGAPPPAPTRAPAPRPVRTSRPARTSQPAAPPRTMAPSPAPTPTPPPPTPPAPQPTGAPRALRSPQRASPAASRTVASALALLTVAAAGGVAGVRRWRRR